MGPAQGQSRLVEGAAKRPAILAVAALTMSCSTPDHVEHDTVIPVCQPTHGEQGHDHTKHLAGLPTCP